MVAMRRQWVAGVAGLGCLLALGACASAKSDGTKGKPVATHEVVSGGARLHGGGYRMDAVVGHAFVQTPATGGAGKAAITAQPASTVIP